eukprot:257334_1
MGSMMSIMKENSWGSLCGILCPIFSLGFGLLCGGIVENMSACDTPSDTQFCYVCKGDSVACEEGNSLTGGCQDLGCWCLSDDGDYFCAETDYGATTVLLFLGILILSIFVIAFTLTIWLKCTNKEKNQYSKTKTTDQEENQTTEAKCVHIDQDSNQLPDGWSELRTHDGRVYYQNEIQQTTQWERPTHNTIINK